MKMSTQKETVYSYWVHRWEMCSHTEYTVGTLCSYRVNRIEPCAQYTEGNCVLFPSTEENWVLPEYSLWEKLCIYSKYAVWGSPTYSKYMFWYMYMYMEWICAYSLGTRNKTLSIQPSTQNEYLYIYQDLGMNQNALVAYGPNLKFEYVSEFEKQNNLGGNLANKRDQFYDNCSEQSCSRHCCLNQHWSLKIYLTFNSSETFSVLIQGNNGAL